MHALVKPKFFIPVHGEQRMMKRHAQLAVRMGMDPNHIVIGEIGRVIEVTKDSIKLAGTVPSGRVLVDGYGVGDVGSVVLRDRKHLAEDGVIVIVMTMSAENGELLSGPDIVTRGFVYVKESEELIEDLQVLAAQALYDCECRHITDWASIKSTLKGELSSFLFKKTKRNPMILPIIMEV